MTQSGIEPATSQLVAQCRNELRHRVPFIISQVHYNCREERLTASSAKYDIRPLSLSQNSPFAQYIVKTTEVHSVKVRHLQIKTKSSSSVKRIFSVIQTFPYEKHNLLFGMQQFAVVKAGHCYLNGNRKDRFVLMHTASVDDVLWRLVEM
jgi:hypothetical protein